MKPSLRASRRGVSLIDMLVLITASALISGAVVTMLMTTLRSSRDFSDDLVRARSFARLDESLRRDARMATAARVEGETLILALPDNGSVRYAPAARGVERRESRGDATRREQFRLQLPLKLVWQVSDAPQRVTLRFASASGNASLTPAWQAVRISTAVGERTTGQKRMEGRP